MSRDAMLRDMEFAATWNARNSKHPEDREKRERSGYYEASTTAEQDAIVQGIILGGSVGSSTVDAIGIDDDNT